MNLPYCTRQLHLIVNSDVVSDNHDYHQFSEQINQANEVLGKQCETGAIAMLELKTALMSDMWENTIKQMTTLKI